MSRTPNYRFLAGFLVVLTALSCWALFYALGPELRPRQPDPPVGLAVDYRRLAAVAARDGLSLPVAMDYVRSLGVDTLVIGEQTLAALVDAGRVHLRWGWEIIDDWRTGAGPQWLPRWAGPDGTGPYAPPFAPWHLLVMPVDPEEGQWLLHALSRRWPGRVETMAVPGEGVWLSVAVPKENPWTALLRKRRFHRYLWPEDERDIYPYHLLHHPLGYSPQQIEEVTAAGFHVALRVEEPALEREVPHEFLGPGADLPPGTWVMLAPASLPGGAPAGDALPVVDPAPAREAGGGDTVERWRDFIGERGWHLGLVGSPRSAAARTLAAGLSHDLMAVHPVWPEESPADLVGRVTGSRVQVLYYQWFMTLTGREGDPAYLDQGRFDELLEGLAAAGRSVGLPRPGGGEGWGGGPPLPPMVRNALVPATAVLGSWAALAVGSGLAGGPLASPLRAALAAAMAGATGIGVGLVPAVLQRQPALMTGALSSPGVALAPLAALAVALWLELGNGGRANGALPPGAHETSGARRAWGRAFTFGHLLVVGAAAGVAGLAFLRLAGSPPGPAGPPGNGPGLMGLLLRAPLPSLETILTVPALLLAFSRPWRREEAGGDAGPAGAEGEVAGGTWSPWPALLRAMGLVGQGAVVGALAHGQIPLTVTLPAACQGTAAGLVLGLVLHWIIRRWVEAVPLDWSGPAVEPGGGRP